MAINFDTSPGGLMVRLGAIGHVAYLLNGVQASLGSFSALNAQYLAAVAPNLHTDYAAFEVVSDALSRAIPPIPMGSLQQLAVKTLLDQVAADVPSAGRSVPAALAEVYRQMVAQALTVKRSAVGVTPTAFTSPSNTGTGTVLTSVTRGDGTPQEHLIAESARLICTADSYSGGQTAGREPFVFTGKTNLAGVWDSDTPQGSGAVFSGVRTIEPTQDASTTGQVLTNGDFETWSGSPVQAENWAITTGVWATDVIKDITAGRPRSGLACARWAATTVLSKIDQQFGSSATTGSSAGTGASLIPQISYAVCLFLRRVSTAITTGTLRVRLIDGSGTTINDTAGTANTFNITLSTLTTSYAAFTGVFRVSSVPPSTVKLRIELTVANDQDFLLDDVMLTPMAIPYPGGPGLAVFAGVTPFKLADGWTVAATNDRGGAAYKNATFQGLFDAFFQTRAFGFLLPSASSPSASLADTLITA